jgi:hypothetical protein
MVLRLTSTVKSSLPPMKVIPFTSFQGPEFSPAFSPDGNQIAFMWWSGEKGGNFNFDIYVKQIGGEKVLQLTSDPAWDDSPVWSPDGQEIAFGRVSESEVAIFTVSSSGGGERKLLSLGPRTKWGQLGSGLSWSADGKLIAYSSKASAEQPFQISLLAPDSLEKRTLTSPPAQSGGDFLLTSRPTVRLWPSSALITTVPQQISNCCPSSTASRGDSLSITSTPLASIGLRTGERSSTHRMVPARARPVSGRFRPPAAHRRSV